jgi:hypothetical protein
VCQRRFIRYALRGLDWTDTYDLPPYFWLHIQNYVRFTEKLVLANWLCDKSTRDESYKNHKNYIFSQIDFCKAIFSTPGGNKKLFTTK